MGLRAVMHEKPVVGIIIAIVMLVTIVAILRSRFSAPAGAGSRFYYDVSNGDLVTYKASELWPPVTLDSGTQGVLAHVFACGDCGGEQFVGYLEKFTEEYIQAASADPMITNGPIDTPVVGHLVAAKPADETDIQWFEMYSPQGDRIVRSASERCLRSGNGRPFECVP